MGDADPYGRQFSSIRGYGQDHGTHLPVVYRWRMDCGPSRSSSYTRSCCRHTRYANRRAERQRYCFLFSTRLPVFHSTSCFSSVFIRLFGFADQ
jgi:hypothetical protein